LLGSTHDQPQRDKAGSSNGTFVSEHDPIEEQYGQIKPAGEGSEEWLYEAKIIVSSATPLVITFLLQYSIDIASLIAAGRLGKIELGAVSC
jgi:MATE family multidrug resistance protein